MFAAQVNGKYAGGDFAGAMDSSRKAKQFAIWGAVIGVVINVIVFIALAASGS